MHPETVDPIWFQTLIRKIFDKRMFSLMTEGWDEGDAMIEVMWYVLDTCRNIPLPELYQEAMS